MIRFTPSAQEALALARKEAVRFNHPVAGVEHLLLGLIALNQGVVLNVLKKMGVEPSAVRQEIERQIQPGPAPDKPLRPGKIPYTPRLKLALVLAGKEAKALNHRYIGTQHLLLGLMREGDGVAARVLSTLGIDLERTRAEIIKDLDPTGAETKSLFIPAGEVDLIRQELAVLRSKVENISLAVDEASHQPPSSSQVTSSLRRLSEPQPRTTLKGLTRVLNYAVWLMAFILLVRIIVNRLTTEKGDRPD